MKAGRKPKPQKILELTESTQRYRDRDELVLETEMPVCPGWVSKNGKKYWDEISISLYNIGILSSIDSVGLALLVDALAQYLEARKECEKVGLTSLTSNGTVVQSACVGAANKAWDRVYKIIRDFGMTPSSRVGLNTANNMMNKGPKDIDISELINVG